MTPFRDIFRCVFVSFGTALTFVPAPILAQTSPITFNVPQDAPKGPWVGVREVYANGLMGDQNAARTSLMNGGGLIIDTFVPAINFFDSQYGIGYFFYEERSFFAGEPSGNHIENLAVLYQGTIIIPADDVYTFLVRSDDGFTLAFDDGNAPFLRAENANLELYNNHPNGALQFPAARGSGDSLVLFGSPRGRTR